MFPHAIFISYILMIVIGLQAITLVAILLKINGDDNSKLFNANRNFIIVSLGLGILCFITYYSDFVIGDFKTSFLYRLVDGMIFYALGLSWIKVIDSFTDIEEQLMKKLRRITNLIFGIFMLISSLAYGFILDEFYNTKNIYMDRLIISLELILVLLVLSTTIFYLYKVDLKRQNSNIKRYLLSISIFVNVCNAWNSLVVLSIFTDTMHISILTTYSYGMTAFFLIPVNSYILFFIYKNYSHFIYEIFRPDESAKLRKEEKNIESIEEAIKGKASNYELTEREIEILELAYKGMTNPEIGETLFISKHTVKRHMHNIFEKMNVSTRLEMVHEVNRTIHNDDKL